MKTADTRKMEPEPMVEPSSIQKFMAQEPALQGFSGQKALFEEIYSSYYEKVFNFCLRMVQERFLAEDITQEAFIRVYEKVGSFRGGSSVSTWVHSIAHNVCMDHFRRSSGWRKVVELLLVRFRLRENRSQEASIVNRHTGMEILADMSPKSRSLLILRQCEGFGYEELAEIFGTTVGSIGVMLNRARKEAVRIAERKGISYEVQ